MKIYVLEVTTRDIEREQIEECIVLANSEKEAIELANKERKAEWFVVEAHSTEVAKVIQSFINHG
ncbi:hypothetical protein MKY15_19780 [Sporosarcina sp. FSL K6-1540]|uniref:hypothetical protein n=1 Tax=Sporosarcina sp. FSL K6-1540 TaxID=2921555 RepID=UPI00315B0770